MAEGTVGGGGIPDVGALRAFGMKTCLYIMYKTDIRIQITPEQFESTGIYWVALDCLCDGRHVE